MAGRFSAQMSSQIAGWPGRDAGHVAKPAGGQPEQRRMLLGTVAGQAHQRRRGEVRHMTDDRDDLVVAIGGQGDDVGTELGDDRCDLAERAVGGGAVGVSTHTAPFEHRRIRAVETLELTTGHRVTADETRVVDGRGDPALHAADIGHEPRRSRRAHA